MLLDSPLYINQFQVPVGQVCGYNFDFGEDVHLPVGSVDFMHCHNLLVPPFDRAAVVERIDLDDILL